MATWDERQRERVMGRWGLLAFVFRKAVLWLLDCRGKNLLVHRGVDVADTESLDSFTMHISHG